MCYVFYGLALIIGFAYPATLSASGTLSFYKDDKFLEMWGDLCLKMGYIGSVLGAIFVLGGMALPPEAGIDPMAKIGGSLAIALMTILYGLIFKYMVIAPWLGCRRK